MHQLGQSNYAPIITRRTRNAPSTWKLWNVMPYRINRETTLISGAVYRQDIFFTSTISFLPSFLPSFLASFLSALVTRIHYFLHRRWASCIGEGEKGESQSRHERSERENEKRSTRVINFHEGRIARALRAGLRLSRELSSKC